MSAPIIWGQGLAGSGIDTATVSPLIVAAPVIWLDFVTGNDAFSGLDRYAPLKTVAAAVTAASAGSVIAIFAGSSETITGTVTINKAGLRFVGFGAGSAAPSFTPTSGATTMFNVVAGGDDCSFENIRFKNSQATIGAGGRVATAVKGTEFISCQFDCGQFDDDAIRLLSGADYHRIDGCVFTVVNGFPDHAIFHNASTTGGKIIDTVIDGSGSVSSRWETNPVQLSTSARVFIKNLTLTGNGSDVSGSPTSYQIFGVTTSGSNSITLT